jgi:hypothetical protein
MKNKFANNQISLELKELGFDEECLAYHTTGNQVMLDKNGDKTDFILLSTKIRGELAGHGTVKNSLFNYLKENKLTQGELYTLSNSIAKPLWQDVIDWFRDEHLLELLVLPQDKSLCDPAPLYFIAIESYKSGNMIEVFNSTVEPMLHYDCYYEAREAAILKCIEIIKEKK